MEIGGSGGECCGGGAGSGGLDFDFATGVFVW